ncbi:MAG: ABC transporter substrate-binding protein [Actinomycetota bacterium]|nr:ABC transporter substrate-binding protein [Actinomycetota bacterium]
MRNLKYRKLWVVLLTFCVGSSIALSNLATAAPKKVKVALSSFQDVCSIYVGVEKRFYKKRGITLDIKRTDWPGANELGVGGQVDIWTTSEADVIQQNNAGADTTLAFPLFYFGGGGLMYDPKKYDTWKTFEQVAKTNKDLNQNIKTILTQLIDKKIGVSSGGGEYVTFVELVSKAGLKIEQFKIIDLAQEELPPALIAGSVDIMIAGIPQRLAVIKQGYSTLMDQRSLPSSIVHAGFGAKRSWVNKNMALAKKIQATIFQTLTYIEKNPTPSFKIISKCLAEGGTKVDPSDLTGVWNIMEYFPSDQKWYVNEVVNKNGKFYWKERFSTVVKNLKDGGKIKKDFAVPLRDLNYGLKTHKK